MSDNETGGGFADINSFLDQREAAPDTEVMVDDGDDGDDDGLGIEPEPETEAPVEPEAPVEEGEDEEAPLDEDRVLTAGEARKLGRQAAKYRTELREFQAHFEGYADRDKEILLETISLVHTDPAAAAERFADFARILSNEEPAAEPEVALDPSEPVTAETVKKMVEQSLRAEREQLQRQRQEQEAQLNIEKNHNTARELGYEPGSVEYGMLLFTALNQGPKPVPLQEAHEIIKEWKQSIISSYIEGKKAKGSGAPKTPRGQGQPAEVKTEKPTTWEGAREGLDAWLKASS